MGRKPKTTGPTARNNPEAFKQVLTRMSLDGWRALRMLAVERDTTINALAVEAFNDLLKKYGRPVDLKDALRRSAGVSATVHRLQEARRKKPRRT